MSDPDRRHSSGASDYDAIFADIVAHLNDDLTDDEQPVRLARSKRCKPVQLTIDRDANGQDDYNSISKSSMSGQFG